MSYSAPAPAPADYPGKTLGIVGLVLAILVPIVGLIISYVARGQSRGAGVENGPAKAGIIVGWILTILWILGIILWVVFIGALLATTATYTG